MKNNFINSVNDKIDGNNINRVFNEKIKLLQKEASSITSWFCCFTDKNEIDIAAGYISIIEDFEGHEKIKGLLNHQQNMFSAGRIFVTQPVQISEKLIKNKGWCDVLNFPGNNFDSNSKNNSNIYTPNFSNNNQTFAAEKSLREYIQEFYEHVKQSGNKNEKDKVSQLIFDEFTFNISLMQDIANSENSLLIINEYANSNECIARYELIIENEEINFDAVKIKYSAGELYQGKIKIDKKTIQKHGNGIFIYSQLNDKFKLGGVWENDKRHGDFEVCKSLDLI